MRFVIAIDPVEFKQKKALEFGATHTYGSVDEALAELPDLTWGHLNFADGQVDLNLFELTLLQKRVQGAIFGGVGPRTQIPRLLQLYRSGLLKLDDGHHHLPPRGHQPGLPR